VSENEEIRFAHQILPTTKNVEPLKEKGREEEGQLDYINQI
jgi:hypothetical protein